jgi:hypothetical protein
MSALGCQWTKTRDVRTLQTITFDGAVPGSQSASTVLETVILARREGTVPTLRFLPNVRQSPQVNKKDACLPSRRSHFERRPCLVSRRVLAGVVECWKGLVMAES